MNSSPIEYILKKDRLIIIVGLFIICVLSWLYIIYLYRQMYPMNMDAMFFAMPMSAKWTATDFVLLFLMWFVMMVAMMMPSVAPLILIFAGINRQRRQVQNPFVPTGYLLSGYFSVWLIFSLLATVLQWLMQHLSLLNPDMIITSKIVGGIILIAAGLFQFTTLKQRCLYNCQTPIKFIHKHWQEGRAGAFRMGVKNGLFCLGCCWILMILLFVSGIMNLLWIAIIAGFVFAEKIFSGTKLVSYISGVALIIYGAFVLLS
jgi:predicted metal-binding membrane protein